MTDTKAEIDWAKVRERLAAGQQSLARVMDIDGKRLQALLDDRARTLAAPETAAARQAKTLHVLVMRVGAERYGLALTGLAGVLPFGSCAAVPGGPAELLGLVNAHGAIWAAFEFHRLLGAGAPEAPADGKVVLLRHRRRRVCLRFDDAEYVRQLDRGGLKKTPGTEFAVPTQFIEGVTSDSIVLVDLNALWTHPAIAEEA